MGSVLAFLRRSGANGQKLPRNCHQAALEMGVMPLMAQEHPSPLFLPLL